MALNPLNALALTDEQREERSGPSFAMHPDEFSRLQDLLAQALKREAEAHRKMKHLHEQLLEAKSPRTRSLSDGELVEASELPASWCQCTCCCRLPAPVPVRYS